MRFAVFSFLVALLAAFVMAAAPHRSVIISWPKDTPDEIVEQSKEAIRQAKGKRHFIHSCTTYKDSRGICAICRRYFANKITLGVITHEYNIIKGFAAQAPASALELVSTLSDVYKCEIEEDGIVTTQNDKA
jgi:hypothetical protein